MAILNGLWTGGSGKVGEIVLAQVNGKQVARGYQGKVTNPQTSGQTEVRAKLKFLSQLSAIYAPVLPMKKNGGKSPRNQFVSANWPFVSYIGGDAMIALADVQITTSSLPLLGFNYTRADEKVNFELQGDMRGSIDGVAYIVMSVNDSQELVPHSSIVTSDAGENGLFPASCDDPAGVVVLYAYGFRYNTKAGVNNFTSLRINTADALAHLMVTSDLSKAISTFTETRGVMAGAEEINGGTSGNLSYLVNAVAYDRVNDETNFVTIPGSPASVVPGASVSFTAPERSGYNFIGWYKSNKTDVITNEATMTATPTKSGIVYAIYDGPQSGGSGGEQGDGDIDD